MKETILNRRSIRLYDKDVKIKREEILDILNLATRAPSSLNMQPWRFVVIDTDLGKEKLLPFLRGNQRQLETSSAMIVLFIDLEKETYSEQLNQMLVDKNLLTKEQMVQQIEKVKNFSKIRPLEQTINDGFLDIGLVASNIMHIAKVDGYDTCAIGGFKHEKGFPKAFGLDEERYLPALIISIGKGAEPGHETQRIPIGEITAFE